MNASVYRNTRFELVSLLQGPNQFRVVAVSRTTPPTINPQGGLIPPPSVTLDLDESMFTAEQMTTVHDALRVLEEVYAQAYDGYVNAPERIVEALSKVTEAESRRKVAELEAQRLEMEHVEKRALLSSLDEEIATKRAAK